MSRWRRGSAGHYEVPNVSLSGIPDTTPAPALVNHYTTPDFLQLYNALPREVRELADKNYELLKASPNHCLRCPVVSRGGNDLARNTRRFPLLDGGRHPSVPRLHGGAGAADSGRAGVKLLLD